MSRVATAYLNAALDAVLVTGTTYYLSCHSADPGTTGANELSAGGYARQAIVFGTAASAGAKSSTTAQTVPNAGTVPVTHTGIWTLVSAGVYICGQALTASVTAASISFPIGAVTENAA
jgi:hypothetical protein